MAKKVTKYGEARLTPRRKATALEIATAARDLHVARDALRRAWTHLDARSRALVQRLENDLFFSAVGLEMPMHAANRASGGGALMADFVGVGECERVLELLKLDTKE